VKSGKFEFGSTPEVQTEEPAIGYYTAEFGQNLPVGHAKCLPQSRPLRLALDCPVRVRTYIRASALDAGRNYNMVIVFAEGA
jgi:hypothetical protein